MSYIEIDTALNLIADIMQDCKITHKHRALNRNMKQICVTDVVKVIRCKDCKWWRDQTCTNVNGAGGYISNPEWFCRSGQRRVEDD